MHQSNILTHLGEERERYFNAVAPPIIQSSNFVFDSVADFRKKFEDEYDNHLYTRGNNPTVQILRRKIAALENAEDALVVGSGAAAVAMAVIGNVQAGDHVVCVQAPYGWTHALLTKFLTRFGVSHTFVDAKNTKEIAAAIQPNTRVLYLESPNSKTFEIQDLTACAALAKQHGITTIIDNSHASPIYQRPVEHGIDIVIHSGTKYLNGHSDVIVGVICGKKEMMKKLFESELMTLGGTISPHDAVLVIRGLRTLPLRIQRSHESAVKIVRRLEKHPKVAKVYFPFSPNFPQYELAQKQMSGAGGLFSIRLKAKRIEEVEAFCDKLERFLMAVSWGGYESLIIPMCGFYNVAGREKPDLPWDFIRFYIGLEDVEWLWEDIEQALDGLTGC